MFEELIPIESCKNKKYLKNIANKGCIVCGAPSVPHHCENILPARGLAVKHDLLAIPLCNKHHNGQLHSAHFNSKFFEEEGIDLEKRIIFYLIDYFKDK